MKNSADGLMQTRLYCGSEHLKIRFVWQLLVDISRIKSQQIFGTSLWDTWKSTFMVSCKLGFIMV
jgi:hypothetical protein